MKVVNVKFISVEIMKFSRDDLFLRINFTDGVENRNIEKQTDLSKIDEFVRTIIGEVRIIEKNANRSTTNSFLDDAMMILFENDEELEERLANVFRRIKEDVRKTRTQKLAQNYLQNITNMQNAKYIIY